jgi:hypothetical protein
MAARDWMNLALRILGVWFAALAFGAIVDLLGTFLYSLSFLIRFQGAEFATVLARVGGPVLQILKYGLPAAALLVFTEQITERLYRPGEERVKSD